MSPAPTALLALLVAGFYGAVTLAEEQYVRYLYPIFPLLLSVCMHGISFFGRNAKAGAAIGVVMAVLVLLDIYKLPSAGWILADTDLRALFDPVRRRDLLLRQVPERLANEAINAIGVDAPSVLYASDPYGAFLRGRPVYTNWYNPAAVALLNAAQRPEHVQAVIDAQGVSFAVVDMTSQQPSDRLVALYVEQYGSPVAHIGSLRVYRVTPAQMR